MDYVHVLNVSSTLQLLSAGRHTATLFTEYIRPNTVLCDILFDISKIFMNDFFFHYKLSSTNVFLRKSSIR